MSFSSSLHIVALFVTLAAGAPLAGHAGHADAQDTTGRGASAPPAPAASRQGGVPANNQPIVPPVGSVARPPALSLRGTVHFADGRAVPNAVVIATLSDSMTRLSRVATTSVEGIFQLDSLPRGHYRVHVDHSANQSTVKDVVLDGGGVNVVDVIVNPIGAAPNNTELFWVVVFLLVFYLTILATRWHHVARPVHEMLHGQLQALITRFTTEVDSAADKARIVTLRGQLEKLEERVVRWAETDYDQLGKKKAPEIKRLFEFVFWSRGRETAAWVEMHEIERQLTSFLSPPEQVKIYLLTTEAELRKIDSKSAIAVAEAIVASFRTDSSTLVNDAVLVESRKALLGRAVSILSAERDRSFTTLMEWQDKASWLLFAALIIIGFLAGVAGHSILFLVGAAGGFSSRVSRAIKATDVPLDYGASWTTLFLSPVFGAYAAWFGVAMITLGASEKVNLLGATFSSVQWDNPMMPETLAVAFLLGFSERFFDGIVGALEKATPGANPAPNLRANAQAILNPDKPGQLSIGGQPDDNGANAASANALVGVAAGLIPPDDDDAPSVPNHRT